MNVGASPRRGRIVVLARKSVSDDLRSLGIRQVSERIGLSDVRSEEEVIDRLSPASSTADLLGELNAFPLPGFCVPML